MDEQEVIQGVIAAIRDGYRPERIIMFGSRAAGKPAPDSDLDLLVIKESDKREVEPIREVSRLVRRFQQPHHLLPMDILVKTPEEVRARLAMGVISSARPWRREGWSMTDPRGEEWLSLVGRYPGTPTTPQDAQEALAIASALRCHIRTLLALPQST